jgi:lysophospholipase L1-like esterase
MQIRAAAVLLLACLARGQTVINATSPFVWIIGRGAATVAGGWQFDWPNTLAFNVQAADSVVATVEAARWSRFRVYWYSPADGPTDGKWAPAGVVWVQPGTHDYVLAAGLQDFPSESNTVTIVMAKMNEAEYNGHNELDSRVTVASFSLPLGGSFVPLSAQVPPGLPQSGRKIEFIGDSITAGFGNSGFAPCSARPFNQEAGRSYPHLICNAFQAECHVHAWSGRGLVKNVDGEVPGSHMPEIERRVWASMADSPEWDFASWVPDVVWINLGTNDQCCGRQWPVAGFESAFVDLLMNLTTRWAPSRPSILAACGPVSATYCPQVQQAVATANSRGARALAVDQTKVYSMNASSVGCLGHPSVVGHKLLAETAIPYISNMTGWMTVSSDSPIASLTSWVE